MKRLWFLVLCLLFVFEIQGQIKNGTYTPQTIIVKFKPQKLKSSINSINSNRQKLQTFINRLLPTSTKKKYPLSKLPAKPNDVDLSNIYEIKYAKPFPVETVVKYLSSFTEIEYAQPDFDCSVSLYDANDTYFANAWHIKKTKVNLAWDVCKGDTNVVIGISDTGFDMFHEDLIGQIKYNWADPINGLDDDGDGYIDNFKGWDIKNNDNNPMYENIGDDYAHGTTVAGLAAAKNDNAKGVSGVGFNCKFLPVRGSSYNAIVYLADHGAKVINCSWEDGLRAPYNLYKDIIDYATFNRDALVICACGNSANSVTLYPASYEHSLSIAGTTINDEIWTPQNAGSKGGSSYGFTVDLSAPATNVYTTSVGNTYFKGGNNGTSFSSPICAGIAGLIRSKYQKFSALQTGEQLRVTSDNIDTIAYNAPYKKLIGRGRANAYRAIIDSITPSIRIVDYTITGLTGDLVRGGDTAILRGSFVNYLNKAKNIIVTVSDYNGYFAQVDAGSIIDSLGTMDTLYNFELRFVLKKIIPYDATVALQLTYDMANGFHDIQFVTLRANPSYLPLSANNIITSVTSVGSIGYAFVSENEGLGFTYKNQPMLYTGMPSLRGKYINSGLVIARDTSKILLNYGSTGSFTTVHYPDYQNTDSTISIESSFNGRDENDVNFNFKINQRATSWLQDSSFVIYEYDIINTSFNSIDSMYTGLIMDWGVSNPFYNKADVNVFNKYGYVYSLEQNQPYVGIKVLQGNIVNHHLIEVYDTIKEIINVRDFDGFSKTDVFKGLTISKPSLSLTKAQADDIIQMVSVKSKNIKIGDTVHVAFALFVASKEQNIPAVVSRSEYRYKQYHNELTKAEDPQISKMKVIPNITSSNFVTVSFESKTKGNCKIIVTDNLGKTIKELNQEVDSGLNSIRISGLKQAGLYYIVVTMNDFSCTEKCIKQ